MRALALLGICAGCAIAQLPPTAQISQTKFQSGQNVVPVYEGWLRNADGSFTFVFGYFNRNWSEEFAIPAGSDNAVEPGGPDQGQPTYFLPRRQSWVYRVRVPADWGNKELVWTIQSHGRTEKAYAQLLLEEEITERIIMTRGNLNPGEDDPNHPPSVSIAPVSAASTANPLTLTALVTDDGLPKPRAAPKAVAKTGQANSNTQFRAGLSVTWFQYAGPAKAVFEARGPTPVADGKAATNVRFTEPGRYILRAIANDGALSTRADITITVGR